MQRVNSSYHYVPTMCQVAPCHFIPPTLLKVLVPDVACRWQNHCHSAMLSYCVMPGLKTKKPCFPGLCQLYSWFGSAEERPWCDVERQEEEGQILAHLRAGSWQMLLQQVAASSSCHHNELNKTIHSGFLLGAAGWGTLLGVLGTLQSLLCSSRSSAAAAFLFPDLRITHFPPLAPLAPHTLCNHSPY